MMSILTITTLVLFMAFSSLPQYSFRAIQLIFYNAKIIFREVFRMDIMIRCCHRIHVLFHLYFVFIWFYHWSKKVSRWWYIILTLCSVIRIMNAAKKTEHFVFCIPESAEAGEALSAHNAKPVRLCPSGRNPPPAGPYRLITLFARCLWFHIKRRELCHVVCQ